jgi:hypothetical protein
MDKQRSTKHTHKTKDRLTRTPLKTRGELRCSGRVRKYHLNFSTGLRFVSEQNFLWQNVIEVRV